MVVVLSIWWFTAIVIGVFLIGMFIGLMSVALAQMNDFDDKLSDTVRKMEEETKQINQANGNLR